jgi:uncharacterized protein YciI
MRHFLLFYDFAPDFKSRREAFRVEHLQLAWAASERAELLLAGALSDAAEQGLLLFEDVTAVSAEQFAQDDPYVRNGLVTHWHVREWVTTVGAAAASPFRARADPG